MKLSDLMALTPRDDDDKALVVPKKDKRTRKMQRFWLDEEKAQHRELMGYIKDKKNESKWQRTVETALMIHWTLEHGRVEWLLAAFPNVEDDIARYRYEQNTGQTE